MFFYLKNHNFVNPNSFFPLTAHSQNYIFFIYMKETKTYANLTIHCNIIQVPSQIQLEEERNTIQIFNKKRIVIQPKLIFMPNQNSFSPYHIQVFT